MTLSKRVLTCILTGFILSIPLFPQLEPMKPEERHYNFSSKFQMDMKGKVMLFVGYRFYYEVSSSVNFVARKSEGGRCQFCFNGIGDTGYMMSTGGLKGSSLWFFTAGYDLDKAVKFRENKIKLFKQTEPYYSENVEKIRPRPMKVLSAKEDEHAVRFERDARGIHYEPVIQLQLSDPHSNTVHNIYKIMGKLLKAYNHSFWPKGGLREIREGNRRKWRSGQLDFSKILTEAARLTSERAKKEARFKQKRKFRLHYKVLDITKDYLDICGEAFPKTRVWKDMKLLTLVRNVRIRLSDEAVVKDEIYLNFRNEDGKGGTVNLKLALREP